MIGTRNHLRGDLLPGISTERIRTAFSGIPNGLSPIPDIGQGADCFAQHGDGLVQDSHLLPRHSTDIIPHIAENFNRGGFGEEKSTVRLCLKVL